MIGLQDLVIKQKKKVVDLAKEMNVGTYVIYGWFKNNKIPKKYLKTLSNIFNIEENYLNEIVNDISTYRPKVKGFANKYEIRGDSTIIYITKRNGETFECLIDTEDLEKLIKLDYSWSVIFNKDIQMYYAKATVYENNEYGKRKGHTVYLHRLLIDYDGENPVDHINHNTLDNRKENLKAVSQKVNGKNRENLNKNNTSGERNVSWSKGQKKWLVQLQVDGKHTWFGRFDYDNLDEAKALARKLRNTIYKPEFIAENYDISKLKHIDANN